MKKSKNNACFICDFVEAKENKPYCKIKKAFCEDLPEIISLNDCPQRTTFVDRMPKNIFDALKDFNK